MQSPRPTVTPRPSALSPVPGSTLDQEGYDKLARDVKALLGIDLSVDQGGVDQECRRGEPQLVLAKIGRALVFAKHAIDDSLYLSPNGHADILPFDFRREEAC